MKIIHLSTYKENGGAAKAAKRLHESMLRYGLNSKFYHLNSRSGNNTNRSLKQVLVRWYRKFLPILDSFPRRKYTRLSGPFSPGIISSFRLSQFVNESKPDIIILHWITDGFINITELLKLKKPIIWVLHDSWAFTGGCHVPQSCKNYSNSCGQCPVLGTKSKTDLSSRLIKRKKNIYKQLNLKIVGPSNWISLNARSSFLLSDKNVYNIPNTIDERRFEPKTVNLSKFNLRKGDRYILFLAMNAEKDPNKGLGLLQKAATLFNQNVTILVAGMHGGSLKTQIQNNFLYLGHISDEKELVKLYNSTELTVVPSLQENLPNTILESLACGRPVVAFDVGGNKDLIEHKKNGYLASPYSINDLAEGVNWILDQEDVIKLRNISRQSFLNKFYYKKVVEEYLSIINDFQTNQ